MTGISCWGNPGTSALTVAVEPGTGAAEPLVGAGVTVAEADDADVGALALEVVPADGEPLGDDPALVSGAGVHAEAATATLTASRANPRDRGVPKSFTGYPSWG
nr:hypothetical protein [Paenarthrobacter ilicis]